MSKPLVSVIIPCYNCAPYLDQCIQSVLAQTYQEIEIITIDDGSTDNTLKILKSYQKSIKIITEKNSGPSTARNNGLKMAKGEWILFLDSDDYLVENSIEILINKSNQCEFVIAGWNGIYENNTCYYGPNETKTLYKNDVQKLREYLVSSCLLHSDIFDIKSIEGPVAKLYKLSIIKNNGITFPTNIHYGEDVCFNVNYLTYCNRIEIIHEGIYNANRHTDSLSNSYQTLLPLFNEFKNTICTGNIEKMDLEIPLCYRYFLWLINDLQVVSHISIGQFKQIYYNIDRNYLKLIHKKYLNRTKKIELYMINTNAYIAYLTFKLITKLKEKR